MTHQPPQQSKASLHKQDVCELFNGSLQDALTQELTGETLVLAVQDSRLQSLLPINGQTSLFDDHLNLPDSTTLFTAPLYNSHSQQDEFFPHNNTERFHFNSNSFDTVVSFFPKCGYFQRGPPFLDMTRITRKGGTLITITGLQPEQAADHDAKWWVPQSYDASLETIRIIRYEAFKTPLLMSIFTVTTETNRHQSATIVTGPDASSNNPR